MAAAWVLTAGPITFLALCLLAGSARALLDSCPFQEDPPTLIQYGGDFASMPLAAGSAITDCTALCCKTPSCVSFSFNNPQPAKTCIGGSCCEAGGVCCMLKSSVMPLVNNTYGPAVTTGSLKFPGPDPPFPTSSYIVNVSFEAPNYWKTGGGDTWPTSWAADGSVVGWCCDSSNINKTVSPMSFWTIEGDPYSGEQLAPRPLANTPIDYMHLCKQYGTPSQSKLNVKPGTVIALNETLYTSVSCMNYGDDPAFNRQHNLGGFLARSTDKGHTWTNVTVVGAFTGRFSAPMYLACGQNYEPCRSLFGGFLYVYFQGAFDDEAYWCNNDAMFLARVREADIEKRGAYEFFIGFTPDGSGTPVWSTDDQAAQPVMTFGSMLGENLVSYDHHINRFIMANFGFIDNRGNPRPWHQEPYMQPHRTQLLMLEAQQPWGPWFVFHRDDNSASAPGLYTSTFPTAYMKPIETHVGMRSADLVMFFSCLYFGSSVPLPCYYSLNWQSVTLYLNTSV